MMKLRKIILLVFTLILGASALTLTGCKTAEGFGEDVENTGEAIQRGTE